MTRGFGQQWSTFRWSRGWQVKAGPLWVTFALLDNPLDQWIDAKGSQWVEVGYEECGGDGTMEDRTSVSIGRTVFLRLTRWRALTFTWIDRAYRRMTDEDIAIDEDPNP